MNKKKITIVIIVSIILVLIGAIGFNIYYRNRINTPIATDMEELVQKYFSITLPEHAEVLECQNTLEKDDYGGSLKIVLKLNAGDKEQFVKEIKNHYEEMTEEIWDMSYSDEEKKKFEEEIRELLSDYENDGYDLEIGYAMMSGPAEYFEGKPFPLTVYRMIYLMEEDDGSFNVYLEY